MNIQYVLPIEPEQIRTRKRIFLDEMERVIPWDDLGSLIAPYYSEGVTGRPPFPLPAMLRIHFMQQWFGLADAAVEEALHDVPLYRSFAGLAGRRSPDAVTILRFRHLLEKHKLSRQMFRLVGDMLRDQGLLLREGTVVDATLIAAPPSTKNKDKARDPAMKQTKKGQQYYFGLKAHIGADAKSGLVHSLDVTSANEHDVTRGNSLLHGDEKEVFGDAGYRGADKRPDAPQQAKWHVSMMRSLRKKLDPNNALDQLTEQIERAKSVIRAKVEFPFRVLKCQFGYRKTRYRGLEKNQSQLETLFALVNIYLVRRKLVELAG